VILRHDNHFEGEDSHPSHGFPIDKNSNELLLILADYVILREAMRSANINNSLL